MIPAPYNGREAWCISRPGCVRRSACVDLWLGRRRYWGRATGVVSASSQSVLRCPADTWYPPAITQCTECWDVKQRPYTHLISHSALILLQYNGALYPVCSDWMQTVVKWRSDVLTKYASASINVSIRTIDNWPLRQHWQNSVVPKYVLCQEETFNKWVIEMFDSSGIFPSQSALSSI